MTLLLATVVFLGYIRMNGNLSLDGILGSFVSDVGDVHYETLAWVTQTVHLGIRTSFTIHASAMI